MESTVDAQQWRLEVERVLPSLRVHVRQDNRVRTCRPSTQLHAHGRALCLECRVSWVRVPPEAAPLFLSLIYMYDLKGTMNNIYYRNPPNRFSSQKNFS